MNASSFMEPFIFNKLIDQGVLYELYENDYTYIEKIFKAALSNFEEDLERLRFCHTSGDLEGLRKAIHKITPTFGFLGIPGIENQCRMFEDMCSTHLSTSELTTELNALLEAIEAGRIVIEEDHRKLIIFNKI
jgi:hypothetical protein